MKFFRILACCLVTSLCFCFWSVPKVWAADLSETSIRLDRQKSATAPGNILVRLQTAEAVTEDSVKVTVPNAWTVSGSASSFTVSTSNLPTGVTALPGVGTATGVSGQAITFPSSDLSAGVTYGFFITGGVGNNPTVASATNYSWQLATVVSSVDSSTGTAGVVIIPNDQIVITATVPADANNFSATLASATEGTTVSQGTTLDFEITYGSDYMYSTPLTLQAEWGLGQISGGGTAEVLEYVVGSATDAYGSTAPVIDTVNRTITWTIASFPATTTGQTVSFSLKTVAGYTGSSLVTLPVYSRIISPTTIPDDTVTHYYQYDAPPVTPTPTIGATATYDPKKSCNATCATDTECGTNFCYLQVQRCRNRDNPNSDTCQGLVTNTPAPTATSGPTSSGSSGSSGSGTSGTSGSTSSSPVESVRVISVSATGAVIEVTVQQQQGIVIKYGTGTAELTSQSVSSTQLVTHTLLLDQLTPQTQYYFQVFSADGSTALSSDIFTLTTSGAVAQPVLSSFRLSSQGISLIDGPIETVLRTLSIPSGVSVEISVIAQDASTIDTITAWLVSDTNQRMNSVPLLRTQSALYSGKLLLPNQTGLYTIQVQLKDITGGFYEIPLSTLNVTTPLKIVDSKTGKPVERAQVKFWLFDQTKRLYELLPAGSFLSTNPLITDSQGYIAQVLPAGNYRIDIEATGYEPATKEFSIRGDATDTYPQIALISTGFNPIAMFSFYSQGLRTALARVWEGTQFIWQSQSAFDASKVMSIAVLLLLMVIVLGRRFYFFGLILKKRKKEQELELPPEDQPPTVIASGTQALEKFVLGVMDAIVLAAFILELLFIPYFGFWTVFPFAFISALNIILLLVLNFSKN